MENNEQLEENLQESAVTEEELELIDEVWDDAEAEKPAAKKVAIEWQKNLLLYVHDLIYLLAIIVVVSLLLLRMVVVSGTSMNRTLLDGDYLLVISNTVYRSPEYGDVVVVSKDSFDNGAPIVKRVIATEGQTVDIDFVEGIVYVDGEALQEEYVNTATNVQEGVSFPLTVDEGCVFVLGDNRNVSHDSRSPDIGQVAVEEILGKAVFVLVPGTNGTDAFGSPKEPRDWTRIGVID